MKTRIALLALAIAALLTAVALAGCSQPTGTQEQTQTPPAESANTTEATTPEEGQLYTPSYQPNGKEVAVIKTSKGDVTVELYGKDAPIHVGNFVELAQKGFYDTTRFHRYEPGFVLQGGDPQTQGLTAEQVVSALQTGSPALGTGGPGYTIAGEFDPSKNPNKHVEGALGMARTQDPNSAGSQFYFTLAPTPFLDGQYTVFGKITDGMDVVKELRAGDEIVSVKIENAN